MSLKTKVSTAKGQALYRRAKQLIPGGTQLVSKRAELYLPDQWPSYYASARGVEVTDLDGNTYIDMSMMGIGACVLGYADPDVDAAVKAAIDGGTATTLNAPEEVELAELLCELHPWAEMVRFARSGGEALMVADLCPNVLLDTSSSNGWMKYGDAELTLAAVFKQALAVAGPDRLLFGTDSSFFPRGWVTDVFERQSAALDEAGISMDAREKIFGGNFDRLFQR